MATPARPDQATLNAAMAQMRAIWEAEGANYAPNDWLIITARAVVSVHPDRRAAHRAATHLGELNTVVPAGGPFASRSPSFGAVLVPTHVPAPADPSGVTN